MLYKTVDAIHRSVQCGVILASIALVSPVAHAAGSGMPWEGPLDQILQSIEGPVARIVAVIIITLTGLTLAFGESSGGFRKLIQIVFGLSIAFAAIVGKNRVSVRISYYSIIIDETYIYTRQMHWCAPLVKPSTTKCLSSTGASMTIEKYILN